MPATSANLGPGFDAIGLALSLTDTIEASIIPHGLDIVIAGEGEQSLSRDENHLVLRAMRATFDVIGKQPTGIALRCNNQIPHTRGLGSSAAAIVGGILAARALAEGLIEYEPERLPDDEVLSLAASIEGHADNVAACLYGGATIAWSADGYVAATRLTPLVPLHIAVYVPSQQLATATARAALPPAVPHGDAARTAARAALLSYALTHAPDLLFAATEDWLHQPYRAASAPASWKLLAQLRDQGFAAALSGAGPSVIVLLPASSQRVTELPSPADFTRFELRVADGARVYPTPVRGR